MVVRWIHKHIIEFFSSIQPAKCRKHILPDYFRLVFKLCLFQILHNALDCIRIVFHKNRLFYTSADCLNPDCPASATIFVNGILVNQKTYSYLERAHGAGFELGNHTQSHKNLKLLPPEKIREEIDSVDFLLRKLDGKARHLLRVPYGNFNDKVIEQAKAPMIDWSIDPEDWRTEVSTWQIYENIWKNKAPGAIVLMHDAYPHTAEAVQMLLPKLYEAGYQVVNVSQLSKALGQPLLTGKVYTHFKQG